MPVARPNHKNKPTVCSGKYLEEILFGISYKGNDHKSKMPDWIPETDGKKMISGPIDLKGRNGLVTGGAKGIGEAMALLLAREGANVAVADITSTQNTVDKILSLGCEAVGINANVAASSDVKLMVKEAVSRFGHIDILVNNAGIVHRDNLLETSEGTWDRVIDVILKGMFLYGLPRGRPRMGFMSTLLHTGSAGLK